MIKCLRILQYSQSYKKQGENIVKIKRIQVIQDVCNEYNITAIDLYNNCGNLYEELVNWIYIKTCQINV